MNPAARTSLAAIAVSHCRQSLASPTTWTSRLPPSDHADRPNMLRGLRRGRARMVVLSRAASPVYRLELAGLRSRPGGSGRYPGGGTVTVSRRRGLSDSPWGWAKRPGIFGSLASTAGSAQAHELDSGGAFRDSLPAWLQVQSRPGLRGLGFTSLGGRHDSQPRNNGPVRPARPRRRAAARTRRGCGRKQCCPARARLARRCWPRAWPGRCSPRLRCGGPAAAAACWWQPAGGAVRPGCPDDADRRARPAPPAAPAPAPHRGAGVRQRRRGGTAGLLAAAAG